MASDPAELLRMQQEGMNDGPQEPESDSVNKS